MDATTRALIGDEFVRSFEERTLTLAYQPIVRLRDGVVAGAEALLRWVCPGIGQVSPSLFVTLAEERGLAAKLGEWVMRDACAQSRSWQTMGIARLRLHFNISHYELRNPGFASLLASICVASGLAPADIAIEVARLPLLLDDMPAVEALRSIRMFGTAVIADDIGDDLSNLSWIERAPIDAVKFNRAFVRALPGDESALGVGRRVIAAVHKSGIQVIALGVEMPTELKAVAVLECDQTQGYYFGSPMETNRFTSLLFESHCTLSVPMLA